MLNCSNIINYNIITFYRKLSTFYNIKRIIEVQTLNIQYCKIFSNYETE